MSPMPTDAELYEQVKGILRHLVIDAGLVEEGQPAFLLVCKECRQPFRNDIELGMVGQHATMLHGWVEGESPLELELVWIGPGPPPEPQE